MPELEFRQIDLRNLNDFEARALNDLLNAEQNEIAPEDPPTLLTERIANWKNNSKRIANKSFAYFEADRIVAYGDTSFELEGDCNPDV